MIPLRATLKSLDDFATAAIGYMLICAIILISIPTWLVMIVVVSVLGGLSAIGAAALGLTKKDESN